MARRPANAILSFMRAPEVRPSQPCDDEGSVSGRRGGAERLFFHGETGFAPGFHAAVERCSAHVSQRAKRGGGEGGYLAELADGDDADGGVGEGFIDAQFELAARLRDEVHELKRELRGMSEAAKG